jgi:formate dehydrogenase subunit delta
MEIEHLIVMANDIAAFFHSAADQDQAVEKVATHLSLYWHPSMRTQIIAHCSTGGTGLSALAAQAVQLLERKVRNDVAR